MTETNSNSASPEIPDNISEAPGGPYSPADDLYRHVNGEFLSSHRIPADRAVDGTFHQLRDQAEQEVREIVEAAQPTSQIGALYASFMDQEGIAAAGVQSLEPDLAQLRGITSIPELAVALGRLDRSGIGGCCGYYVAKDATQDVERAYLTQSGLGLPDEAYYREQQHAPIREAYVEFITDMLQLLLDANVELPGATNHTAGTGNTDSSNAAEGAGSVARKLAWKIMDFETALAAGHWDNVTNRDADKTYNPTPVGQLPQDFPFRDWMAATGADVTSQDAAAGTIIVCQPSYLTHVAELAVQRDLNDWLLWASWRILTARAGLLPEEFSVRNFEFYGKTLSGSEEQRARWKRGVALVESQIGEEVGKIFVQQHFPPAYKQRMLEMVDYLIAAYEERISALEWMTPATREKALAKLQKFRAKIGYPDKWRDYSGLEFSPHGGDLLDNVRRGTEFNHDFELSKLGKPADRQTWFCPPQTVNAFYNPVMNDITFPAAILRPPFFNPEEDMAGNFGAIGAVIGHEIGHGFDDQGSKYDGDGNLHSWWTEEDREAFTRLTDKLQAQFDGLIPAGLRARGITEHAVNGAFTLGENIGDLGGLGIAIVALRRYLADQGHTFASAPAAEVEGMEGSYTALQRVFLRWARVWQTAIRPQMSAQYLSIDPHSPAEYRCNVVSSNIAEFYTAFGVQPGDGMWMEEEDRVTIW